MSSIIDCNKIIVVDCTAFTDSKIYLTIGQHETSCQSLCRH